MRNGRVISTIAIGLMLALGTGAASASRAIRPLTLTTVLRSNTIAFRGAGGLNIICANRLGISFHGDIEKFAGVLAGFVTEGTASGCVENLLGLGITTILLVGRGTIWHITYRSFSGALPNISSVLFVIHEFAVLFRIPGPFGADLECLYRGDIGVSTEGNPVRSMAILSGNTMRLVTNLRGTCQASGELEGSYTLGTTVALTLI